MERAELERASELCRRAGAWLLLDNTYEHFAYGGRAHHCISAPHVLNLFSFSKVRRGPLPGARRGRGGGSGSVHLKQGASRA